MHEAYERLDELTGLLNAALSEAASRGRDHAQAERDYRVAVRKEILAERDRKTPVTIMSDVVRGREEIADLKFARDCAEALYKSANEAINVYKLQVRVIDGQIAREWNSS